MTEKGTRQELVALVTAPHAGLARVTPAAAFVSQLIAARDRLAPQRERRRAPLSVAVGAYASGSHIADRRLPPGYRTTRDA